MNQQALLHAARNKERDSLTRIAAPSADFAARKAAVYAAFEESERIANARVESKPLVVWATRESARSKSTASRKG